MKITSKERLEVHQMSRINQSEIPKVKVFVEGYSEENYIKSLKKLKKLTIIETPVNLKGGGYTTFIQKIKEHPFEAYLATFLILDMDRYSKIAGEENKFKELIKLCNKANRDSLCFVIGNNDNIETFFEMHFPDFKPSKKNFLKSKIKKYDKNDNDIFDKLNKDNRGYSVAIHNQNKINKISIENQYSSNKKNIVNKNKVIFHPQNLNVKHSNMFDMFDILKI